MIDIIIRSSTSESNLDYVSLVVDSRGTCV